MLDLREESARILLVEESPSDRALLERLFRPRLTVADSAEAALAAVRRQSFAVILLAQALPRRSGLELLRELRASGDATPIVLMTEDDGETEVARTALAAGAAACVVKQPGFERELPAILERAGAWAQAGGSRAADARGQPRDRGRTPRHLLVFEIAGQRHGVFADDVEAVTRAVAITPLPGAAPGVEGCVDYRGRLVPVLDLRARLGLAPKAIEAGEHLVITRRAHRLMAIRADRAVALVAASERDLENGDELAHVARGIVGVARLAEGPVVVHDLAQLPDLGAAVETAARRRTDR